MGRTRLLPAGGFHSHRCVFRQPCMYPWYVPGPITHRVSSPHTEARTGLATSSSGADRAVFPTPISTYAATPNVEIIRGVCFPRRDNLLVTSIVLLFGSWRYTSISFPVLPTVLIRRQDNPGYLIPRRDNSSDIRFSSLYDFQNACCILIQALLFLLGADELCL